MRYQHLSLTLATLSLFALSGFTSVKAAFEVHSYVEGGVDFIKGYSQVPPLDPLFLPVSSYKRPTFNELGIDTDLFCGLGIDVKYDTTWIYFHYQQVTPSNCGTLTQDLTTIGEIISAGQLFSMRESYQWMNVGLGTQYTWMHPCLKIMPMIDFNWIDYLYNFSADTVAGYANLTRPVNSLFSVRVGGRLDYQYRDMFSTQLILMGAPPFLPLTIYEANLSVAYHLYDRNNFRIRPYVGIKWLFFDINDNRDNNLHARYEARPAVFVGFNFLM